MRRFIDWMSLHLMLMGFERTSTFLTRFGTPFPVHKETILVVDIKDADPAEIVFPATKMDVN